MNMKNIVLCLVALLTFSSCHRSEKSEPGKRGWDSMIVLLLPEAPYDDCDVVNDVIQQIIDMSVETGVTHRIFESAPGEYDNMLREILSTTYPEDEGNTLFITLDNSMQLTIYESTALGKLQKREHHRIELYGVGYLSGVCIGLMDLHTLVLQDENLLPDNMRYGEGFRVGFEMMNPESDLVIQSGRLCGINELYQYASDYNWDVIVTNYGVGEGWNGQKHFDFDVDYGYGRIVGEYLNTWIRYKNRAKVPDEVVSLSSGYIRFIVNNERLLGEVFDVHWPEAIELEKPYINPFVTVE